MLNQCSYLFSPHLSSAPSTTIFTKFTQLYQNTTNNHSPSQSIIFNYYPIKCIIFNNTTTITLSITTKINSSPGHSILARQIHHTHHSQMDTLRRPPCNFLSTNLPHPRIFHRSVRSWDFPPQQFHCFS